jgi:4-deoxy-L-threo-5-hexosulose-uronate ketol-isomerase
MEIKYESSKKEVSKMNTDSLRDQFLFENLFKPSKINLGYSHYDRLIVGGAIPLSTPLPLPILDELKSEYFLERREIGIINVGGNGRVSADGQHYTLPHLGCLYLGKGTKDVSFSSDDSGNPAVYYLLSATAHKTYLNQVMLKENAVAVQAGRQDTSNLRTIHKYIFDQGIQSCQLVMGLTILHPGNVWNTMPAHVHDRRTEAYFYFDIPENQAVIHLMGEPDQTKHIFVSDRQVVISPPWSIHSGCGTANYSFVWGMAGENKEYMDMDMIQIQHLR